MLKVVMFLSYPPHTQTEMIPLTYKSYIIDIEFRELLRLISSLSNKTRPNAHTIDRAHHQTTCTHDIPKVTRLRNGLLRQYWPPAGKSGQQQACFKPLLPRQKPLSFPSKSWS